MQGEYNGDFTRDTFHPVKHFSRVLMQQGRVQLDADWNEQTAILLHYLRGLAKDLIGPFGGPALNLGFSILDNPGLANDFQIGPGNYYVDGILCELDATAIPATVIAAKPPAAPNRIQVARLTVDGVEFRSGQRVELLDPTTGASSNPPVFAVIDGVDASAQTLTVKDALAPAQSGTALPLRRITTYLSQSDFPNSDSLVKATLGNATYLVYLDVWERHLTSVAAGSIREVALGGPDTASRAKVMNQVKITYTQPDKGNSPIPQTFPKPFKNWRAWVDSLWSQWTSVWQPANRGLLKARVQPQATSTDPCTIAPASSYRGAENQLYRIEIQGGGSASVVTANNAAGAATFKWSRENGSVVFPILKLTTGSGVTTVNLANLGRDERLSLHINDWVELADDHSILLGTPQPLLQVQAIDAVTMVVTLAGTAALTVNQPPSKHPLLRRWDHQQSDPSKGGLTIQKTDGGALIVEGTDVNGWLNLEDGLQIQFQPSANYRSGDYWLIPARVATGDLEWPRFLDANNQPIPDALPPHGVEHHYAPLAVISVNPADNTTTKVADLRQTVLPIVQPTPP